MQEEKRPVKKAHNVILESRRQLSVSGVLDVDSFDENEVVLFTDYGALTVAGSMLHVNKMNVESGELQVEGEIGALYYSEGGKKGGGLFARLVK